MTAAPERAKAEQTEAAVVAAWQRWYSEALDSVRTLPVRGSSDALDARVTQAQGRLDQAARWGSSPRKKDQIVEPHESITT